MNVEHAAGPAPNEPGRQQPHESGEAHQIDPVGRKLRIERAFERLALFAKRRVIDDRGGDAFRARTGEARSLGSIRGDEHDFGRIVFRLGRLDQRRHIRSTAGDEHGDALLAHAPHQERSRRPRKSMRASPFAATISPSRTTVSPFAVNCSRAAAAAFASSTATMPMPQLKVRNISCSLTSPEAASHLNTGWTGTQSKSNETESPRGSTRGIFSTKPPPVM